MLDSVSPYALLRASIPRGTPTVSTAYDLFSAVQQSPEVQVPDLRRTAELPAGEDAPAAPPAPLPPPARRTHYIADIQTRHNAAVRHAAMRDQPLT